MPKHLLVPPLRASWALGLAFYGCYVGPDASQTGDPGAGGGTGGSASATEGIATAMSGGTAGAGTEGSAGSGSATAGTGMDPGEPGVDCNTPRVASTPLRRLSRLEYQHAIRDLFGIAVVTDKLMPDALSGGFETNATIPVSLAGVEEYQLAAESVADALDPAALVSCDLASGSGCVRTTLAALGRRIYRRPLEPSELDALVAAFDTKAGRTSTEAGLRFVLATMLQSPHFLYRPEFGTTGKAGVVAPLSPFELASRLSFLVWASIPDETLLDAAASGGLADSQALATQAKRMLADGKAEAAIRSFHRQWLGLPRLERAGKDATLYPEFTPELRSAMKEETERFTVGVVRGSKPTLETLLTGRETYVNRSLAELYGIAPPANDFDRVPLPADERLGLLTQASFLAANANADQASPILRGRFVRTRILCQPIPDPPAGLVVTPPQIEPGISARARFEQHAADPKCASCHRMMDPIGFAFSHYDAIGRFQEMDRTFAIDATGSLSGTQDADGPFDGALELSTKLSKSQTVLDCYATQWFQFGIGRAEAEEDTCSLDALHRTFVASGGDIPGLIVAIVQSDAFRFVQPEGT